MKWNLLIVSILTLLSSPAEAALLHGRLLSPDGPVAYAQVRLLPAAAAEQVLLSEAEGGFSHICLPGALRVVVRAAGYLPLDTQILLPAEGLMLTLHLEPDPALMDAVVISGTLKEVSRSASPVAVEVLSPAFFQRNPTPDLFSALQQVNGVRPQINCSVCGTGDIHLNGMEGPYTMVTLDGMPIVSGLSTVYGLQGIPASLIERVEVIKGPASTLYGSEAVGGLINVITRSPERAPRLSAEVNGSTWLELNADLGTSFRAGRAQGLLGVQLVRYRQIHDRNTDGFTDMPLVDRVSVFSKWSLPSGGARPANLAARYVYEDRWGGQLDWTPAFRGGDSIYGESIQTRRAEVLGFWPLPVRGLELQLSWNLHQQRSAYGQMIFDADQQVAFGQLRWEPARQGRHQPMAGLSLRGTRYDDSTPATVPGPETVWLPGAWVQEEVEWNAQHRTLAGLRADYHPDHGWILAPRLNHKWSGRAGTLRIGGGNGFRTVNLFTEDHAALTGARQVVIEEALRPETSWNANLNYQRFLFLPNGLLNLDASAFYTWFGNRILPDYGQGDDLIVYANLDGHAVSRGVSVNVEWSAEFPLRVQAGATWLDVYQVEQGVRSRPLLTERYSATWSLTWEWARTGLSLDYTGNLTGPMRMPLLEQDFRPEYSPAYSIQNVQLSWQPRAGGPEWYAGVKNLLDFTPPPYSLMRPFDPFDQHADDPVSNPFGYTFDASYAFAPNQGIRGFAGLRWRLD